MKKTIIQIEEKIKRCLPYMCKVMGFSPVTDEELSRIKFNFTIEASGDDINIKKVEADFKAALESKSKPSVLDLEITENEMVLEVDDWNSADNQKHRVVFKKFKTWEEFLNDEVSI